MSRARSALRTPVEFCTSLFESRALHLFLRTAQNLQKLQAEHRHFLPLFETKVGACDVTALFYPFFQFQKRMLHPPHPPSVVESDGSVALHAVFPYAWQPPHLLFWLLKIVLSFVLNVFLPKRGGQRIH